jgi:hypothetical protein
MPGKEITMAVTIEELKRKVARLQRELAEVSAGLDELAAAGSAAGRPADPLAGRRFSDPKALLPVLDRAFAEMGIDVTGPALTPKEVQDLMLREGVRPEDNILSRGIIAAREE